MANYVNLYDAKTHLSALVERAADGEEIVIAKAGRALARLVAMASKPKPMRKPGGWKGKLWVARDFDAPLPADVLTGFNGGTQRSSCSIPTPSFGGRRTVGSSAPTCAAPSPGLKPFG